MGVRRSKGRRSIDLTTFSIYLGLVTIGWLMIYSVGYHEDHPDGFLSSSAGKQAIWIGISFLVFGLVSLIDWKYWRTFAYPIYAVSIALLISVLLFGVTIKGAKSWFAFGSFSFQPAELAKFGTALAVSGFLSTYNINLRNMQHLLTALGLFTLPMVLILAQPDAGSALVFFAFFLVLYRAGLNAHYYLVGLFISAVFIFTLIFGPGYVVLGLLLICLTTMAYHFNGKKRWWTLGGVAASTLAAYLTMQGLLTQVLIAYGLLFGVGAVFMWHKNRARWAGLLSAVLFSGALIGYASNYAFNHLLQPHQQDRINVWLKPSTCDPRGALYNVLQSKMAIGSGGFDGKGFLQGTMTKLNYVPEQSTDFIFCTIGEEQGFIGTISIVVLFFLLLYRITVLAERQRSAFSRYYAYSVAGILFVHFFINIGMTMGLMPIIGIPLPFLSKGGSSLLGFTVMIAVLLKLDRNRFQI